MAKRKIEDELEQLSSLRKTDLSESSVDALRKALRDPVNVIVARAAKIGGELSVRPLIPDMLLAFDRLFQDPVKRDPQCWGKNMLSKALKDLGHAEAGTFLRGLRHVQMEPVWEGNVDTAANLRGTCALALTQCTNIPVREIHTHLVDILADRSAPVRVDAARALAELGTPEAILLLRLKARVGDEEPSVTGAILEYLLRLEEDRAVDFAGTFLDSVEDQVREEAALALGASRSEAAITYLQERLRKCQNPGLREILIRGLGASRLDSALSCLIQIVHTGKAREALWSLQALEAHRESMKIHDEIEQALGTGAKRTC
ncbi:MAG: HEAT repeat domain-containing protein [Acidobacteriota bacterium]|nr:HEAT repeat domain-containing protein [Acidobacteriota bacterium]